MSFHDRHYQRSDSAWSGDGGGTWARVAAFFSLSFPIGRYWGIAVRVHILFVLLLATQLLPDRRLDEWGLSWPQQALWTLRWTGLLFISVLLHEFGHCFGCRAVGGQADEILMWPLGGLAYCRPPRRPWPEFVTVACGPLVNVVLAAASFAWLAASVGAASPVRPDPFNMIVGHHDSAIVMLVADLFVVNYGLLLFNLLLVFYPFDGGRLVQIALWTWLGYSRSMAIATTVGMAGAVVVGMVGLWQLNFLLVFIALFGFITCMQQRRFIMQGGDAGPDFDPRFAAAYETSPGRRGAYFDRDDSGDERARRPGMFARWRARRAARREATMVRQAKVREAEVDRILDKVRDAGLASLTPGERRTLQQASERKRSM